MYLRNIINDYALIAYCLIDINTTVHNAINSHPYLALQKCDLVTKMIYIVLGGK